MLVSFLHAAVFRHATLEAALSVILANKLHTAEVPAFLFQEAFAADPSIRWSIRADLLAARTRDPAARGYA
jgi:serine O-acetyltransferase